MEIVGYGDRLSVARGERIRFMVSTPHPQYEATLVRPSHSPQLRRDLDAPLNGTHAGREQALPKGSYVRFPRPVPRPAEFRLEAWICPTAPDAGEQGLMTWGTADGLFVNAEGAVELRVGGSRVTTGVPLRRGEWYRVAGELTDGRATVSQTPRRWSGDARASAPCDPAEVAEPLRIGDGFDGKIDAPRIDGVASWDFAIGIGSTRVTDVGPNLHHGETVNMPMRGVTGWNWTGRSDDFRQTPGEYGAIHFHRDDMDDACWEPDFDLEVPHDLPSGLYAIRLRAGGAEDHIPFFVRPARGRPTARIAFLAPTFSYLAYSCEHSGTETSPSISPEERERMNALLAPEDLYSKRHELLSAYDHHSDGTGNCFVSRLRPIPNMRPYYISPPIQAAHQLGADLHVLDWLSTFGEPFDVITDEDLHHEGLELLEPYRVILTGTHPEYWSEQMLDATEAYLDGGGRFMYLGGNGMYWVTSVHPERPHVLEIRRTYAGTRAWQSAPGECHQACTGEPSGLWRFRGRAPQRLFLVGMAAHGYDVALGYERLPASHDPEVAWIFDGVEGERFGDFGAIMGGAAGFEIDRVDDELGTPPHAVLLATARGFSDSYQAVVEDTLMQDSLSGGTVNANVHADVVYAEHPNGAAVFATGSVTWGGSLTHNGGDNDVARITGNVLRRFAGG
ncbi:LamG domain-containing protein [Capillimicrobium parvum]|uniref:N,N-dimethylformamidase beta subunit n=1 Tax=Capillimicrobium parvum TaxID=2884022 RepID=A0A9E7C0V4_9ACTN|nr:LamG domain-containing protein [Capillimicrobium parvum]UGS36014.1 N,N-dimethylformamidase beta subunit [Capillimicrobium parvum]